MNTEIVDYFNELAPSALSRNHDRVADRKFFESVQARLLAGKDLSPEMADFAHVSTDDALTIVEQLIHRCNKDMRDYWILPPARGIETQVQPTTLAEELIPSFTATYTAKTEFDVVAVPVASQGNHTDLNVDTSLVQTMDKERAMSELASLFLVARLMQR